MKKIISLTLVILLMLMSINAVFASNTDSEASEAFIENVFPNTDYTDGISAIICFDYEKTNRNVEFTNDPETDELILQNLRAANKAYYSQKNNEYLEETGFTSSDMHVSGYSPYVFVEYETYEDYLVERDALINLSKI